MKKIFILLIAVLLLASCESNFTGHVRAPQGSGLYIDLHTVRIEGRVDDTSPMHEYIYFTEAPDHNIAIVHDPDCKYCKRRETTGMPVQKTDSLTYSNNR